MTASGNSFLYSTALLYTASIQLSVMLRLLISSYAKNSILGAEFVLS